jgi:hypothetical protein
MILELLNSEFTAFVRECGRILLQPAVFSNSGRLKKVLIVMNASPSQKVLGINKIANPM